MKRLFIISLIAFNSIAHCQTFPILSIKCGQSFSGQIKTPPRFADGGIKRGYSFTIEPTILSFGTKKQFNFNTDISFIQKGGMNYSPILYYDQYGQLTVMGSEGYPVTINYFSISPTIKAQFWKVLFVKAGPRIDALVSINIKDKYSSDPRTRKDFNPLTYGITYGLGISQGNKRMKFILEIVGQNDFSNSSYNKASGQTFKNFCYIINCGVTIALKKQEE